MQELAAALPETNEERWYGTPAFKVAGKGFVRKRPEDGVITLPSEEKRELMASEPDVFFETPHYEGSQWLLVRLPKIKKAELRELLTDAWRMRAPTKVLKAHPEV